MRHDLAIAIDDVRPVIERDALIEGEEFILDGNFWIARGGDRGQQVESAAEFLVEDGPGQIVATLRAAAEKEPAAQLVFRLVDRDVRSGRAALRMSNAAAASPPNPPPTICAFIELSRGCRL